MIQPLTIFLALKKEKGFIKKLLSKAKLKFSKHLKQPNKVWKGIGLITS